MHCQSTSGKQHLLFDNKKIYFWSIKLGRLNSFINTKKAFKKLYMFHFEIFRIFLIHHQ